MALSRIVYPGDGVTKQFAIPFALGYMREADVACRVGDEQDGSGTPLYRTLTFLSEELVEISGSAPEVGVNAVFTRTIDRDTLLVNYEDHSIINENNMNTAQKQALMLVHEVLDGRFEQFQSDIDMGGWTLRNSGRATEATDVPNLGQVLELATGQAEIVFVPGEDTVTTDTIQDGAVTEPKHATGGVSQRAIAIGAVDMDRLDADVHEYFDTVDGTLEHLTVPRTLLELQSDWHPIAAPPLIHTFGYRTLGKGETTLVPGVIGKPGGLSLVLDDASLAHYEIATKILDLESSGVRTGTVLAIEAVDNALRINDAYEYLNSRGGGALLLPPDLVQVARRLRYQSNVALCGHGWISKLHAHATWSGDVFSLLARFRNESATPYSNVHFSDFELSGPLDGGVPSHIPNSAGIIMEFINDSSAKRLRIIQANDGGIQVSGYKPGTEDFSYFGKTCNSVTINNGGSGYSGTPTITFAGGGFGGNASPLPTATVQTSGGVVVGITMVTGGSIYDYTTLTATISGGGGSGATVTPVIGWNPYHGGALRNIVEDCTISGTFLGLEMVGGAQARFSRNIILNGYHGIRLAGGGWSSVLEDNSVMTCDHTAFYSDFNYGLLANNNIFVSARPSTPTGASIGEMQDAVIRNNVFVGTFYDDTLDGTHKRSLIEGNRIEGDMRILRGIGVRSKQNEIRDYIRLSGSITTGISQDDLAGGKLSPAAGAVFDNLRSSVTWAAI